MPPRFAYWTILIDGQPTAFRARDAQELRPTLAQLKRTNQDVLLRWFARGKLWESPDAERAAGRIRKPAAARGPDWRPGGDHKDPRAFWREKKKAQNQKRRAEKHARRERRPQRAATPPGDRPSPHAIGGRRPPRFPRPRFDGDRWRPEDESGPGQRPRSPHSRRRKPGPPKR